MVDFLHSDITLSYLDDKNNELSDVLDITVTLHVTASNAEMAGFMKKHVDCPESFLVLFNGL